MPDDITFTDCCRIILEQGPPDCQPDAPDERGYRRDLLALLNKEFDIEWEDTDAVQMFMVPDADGNRWNESVPALANSLVRYYGDVVDPFAGILEYTSVNGEMKVWKEHKTNLQDAVAVLKHRYVAFFRDLLLLRWPKAAHRTTSWEKLQAHGLVIPVCDDDF